MTSQEWAEKFIELGGSLTVNALTQLLNDHRSDVLEEAATVAEQHPTAAMIRMSTGQSIADAIRAITPR